MRRLKENPKGKLRSVQGVMEETNLSRYHVMRIAEAAGAVVRFGSRGIRIDAELFYLHLRKAVE